METISRFDCQDTFLFELSRGLNMFCGAGFSVEASDKHGKKLPAGPGLLNDLKDEFPDLDKFTRLDRASAVLERKRKAEFYDFLRRRFTVGNYDELYTVIPFLHIQNIYTTNIDDLFVNIYSNCKVAAYLNDCSFRGQEVMDISAVNYYPLHGSVTHSDDKFIFGDTEIASVFSEKGKQEFWKQLRVDATEHPILFWGWNFADAGPLEAMYGADGEADKNTKRWVLLYEPYEETISYLETLGYNLIIGETKSLLQYFKNLLDTNKLETGITLTCGDINAKMREYLPPKDDKKLTSYPLEDFFTEYTPRWSHIYSKQVTKTQWYKEIENKIHAGRNLVVYGIRGAGKTTLMMQLIYEVDVSKYKFYIISPTSEQAEAFTRKLNGEQTLLFVDDCFRDTEALNFLCRQKNIQVVALDRDFNYESQYAQLDVNNFVKPTDITEIQLEDAQKIFDSVPGKIRSKYNWTQAFMLDPTMPNLMSKAIKPHNFGFLKRYCQDDILSAELFLLVCYVHSCGGICSFDMIYSYLGDSRYNWQDMLKIINRFGKLVEEEFDILKSNENQSYYLCRSRIFAENIVNSAVNKHKNIIAKVLMQFVDNVPVYKICLYDKFRRSGYDGGFMARVYEKVEEGEKFYELCALKDMNEYMCQQAAIYFSIKKEYKKAFEWIDKARNMTHYNVFSINSTYAKIYFEVNLYTNSEEAAKALDILNNCCTEDRRKAIHYVLFSDFVIKFLNMYPETDNLHYAEDALKYVDEGLTRDNWVLSKKNQTKLRTNGERLRKIIARYEKE